jgi:dCTP deaminase
MAKSIYPGQGAFSLNDLKTLVTSGRIETLPGFDSTHVGPASIDVSVTEEAYRVDHLLTPSGPRKERVRDILPLMGPRNIKFGDVMEVGSIYLAKATISANFCPGIYGYFNPKSTSGRNFLLVRAITDYVEGYDTADRRREGYTAEFWLALQPLAFPIVFNNKERYNQLRMFDGDTRLNDNKLAELLLKKNILHRRDSQMPYRQGELSLFAEDGSIFCTLYAPAGKLVGYRAKRTRKPLDLSSRGLDPREYFEPIYAEETISGDSKSGIVRVRAHDHLLLCTNEMLNVPVTHCAELRALDPRLGLFFSHFAGFFDPGFFGSATLEVLAPHDMVLRHRQAIARFVFEEMRSKTVSYKKAGTYHGQVDTQLPKQFAEWKF